MSQKLSVIKTIPVDDTVLQVTNVLEDDHPMWLVATTYELGDRVMQQYVDVTPSGTYVRNYHKIYESVQPGNTGKDPATEPTWWAEVSPTNAWKMFDLSTSTQTQINGWRYYQFAPGRAVNGLALVGVSNIDTVRVRLTDPTHGTVYDKSHRLRDIPSSSSWYSWTFDERVNKQSLEISDIPTYPSALLLIEITPIGATGYVGACVFGQSKTIGTGVHAGAKLGIVDYSRKEKNEYGDTVLVQRAYSSRASYTMHINNSQLDNTMRLLTDLRATPCVWSIPGSFEATTIFGYYSSFDITVQYAQYAVCNIDIEGLA